MRVFILEQNEKGELLYPVTNEFGSGSAPVRVEGEPCRPLAQIEFKFDG